MREFLKNKVVTILVVVATVILAGVAIFTALRLYQLRTQPVAPTAPERPRAEELPAACGQLAFTITAQTPTPTSRLTPTQGPTPSLTLTPTQSPTPTQPPVGGTSPTPTSVPSSTPTSVASSTPSVTQTQIAAASPTPGGEALPSAGVSLPTIFGLSLGILIIMAALLIAF